MLSGADCRMAAAGEATAARWPCDWPHAAPHREFRTPRWCFVLVLRRPVVGGFFLPPTPPPLLFPDNPTPAPLFLATPLAMHHGQVFFCLHRKELFVCGIKETSAPRNAGAVVRQLIFCARAACITSALQQNVFSRQNVFGVYSMVDPGRFGLLGGQSKTDAKKKLGGHPPWKQFNFGLPAFGRVIEPL